MRWSSGFVFLMLTLASAQARADEQQPAASSVLSPSDSATSGTRVIEEWYGWQTMIVDAAALSTVFVGLKKDSMNIVGAGVLGYVLLPPMVHAAHGDLDSAGFSLLIRMVGGGVGPGICAAAISGDSGNADGFKVNGLATCLIFGVPLTVLGVLGASAVDAGPLSQHKRTVAQPAPAAPRIIPIASTTPSGAQVGVAGTF